MRTRTSPHPAFGKGAVDHLQPVGAAEAPDLNNPVSHGRISLATHDPVHGPGKAAIAAKRPLVQIAFSAQGTQSFRDARPASRLFYVAVRAMP